MSTEEVLDVILARATGLPFVVLVGWLERLLVSSAAVGRSGPFRDERIRFRHSPSLGFPTQDVTRAGRVEGRDGLVRVEIETSFGGLTGASSPLPLRMIEGLDCDDDDAVIQREFFDLFHHRLLGLAYRALLKTDLPRANELGHGERLRHWMLTLAGLERGTAARLAGLAHDDLMHLAPLLCCYPQNEERVATGLRLLFGAVLGEAHIRVATMKGGYVLLEPSALPRMGKDLRLGVTSTLGRRIAAPASEIHLEIGPLTREACTLLAPGGALHGRLVAAAALLVPEHVETTIQLLPGELSPMRLGRAESRLGRGSWLGRRGSPAAIRVAAGARSTRGVSHDP